jgi:methyl-accepting chemotaxis protein
MRFTIARKLWLAFAIVLLFLAVVAVLSVISLSAARTATVQLIDVHAVVEAVDRSAESMLLERVLLTQYVATGDPQYSLLAEDARNSYWDSWAAVVEYGAQRQLEIVAELEDVVPQYSNLLDWAVESYERNPEDVELILSQLNAADEYFSDTVSPLRDELYSETSAEAAQAEASVERLLATMRAVAAVVGILAFVAAVLAAYLVSRDITQAATHLTAVAESISRGDLDVTIEVKTGDEMEDLAESLERMRASLKAAVERLRRRRSTA